MSSRNAPTVPMSDDLLESIDGRLDYGDSRANWIREACRQRLERESGSDTGENSVEEPADD